MDSVGVKTNSDCSGDGMVSFYSIELREVDLDMDGRDHFNVRELPDMKIVDISNSVDLLLVVGLRT